MVFFFNGNLPRYPNSEIVNSIRLKNGCYAELETNDSGKRVFKYYKDHLTNLGWSIQVERKPVLFKLSNINDSKSATFLALFKDNTGLMIDAITPTNGGKTQIALFIGDTDG